MSWKNFWRTWWLALTRPGESFRVMTVGAEALLAGRGHAFMGASIVLASIIFIALGKLLEWCLGQPGFGLKGDLVVNLLLALFILWSLTVIETWGVKLFSRRRRWPSSARWARHVTSYATAGWLPAAALWGFGMIVVDWFTTPRARPLGTGTVTTFLNYPVDWYLNAIVFVLGLLCFEILVYVGVRQVRYANAPAPRTKDFTDGDQGAAR